MTNPFQVEDIHPYQRISELQCSPTSASAVCTVNRVDVNSDGPSSQLWYVPLDGSGPRKPTSGDSDESPKWSPDGERLAFIATRGNGRQIYLIDPQGGEADQLSHIPSGCASFEWSPDGKSMLVCCAINVDPEIRGDHSREQHLPRSDDAPHIIWRLPYKMNGVGYTLGAEIHAYLLNVDDGEHRALT